MRVVVGPDSQTNTDTIIEMIHRYWREGNTQPVLCIIEQSNSKTFVNAIDTVFDRCKLHTVEQSCSVSFRYRRLGIEKLFKEEELSAYGAIFIGELLEKQDIDEIASISDDVERAEAEYDGDVTLFLSQV